MTTLASKSVPQPTKPGLRPERQSIILALYLGNDRTASARCGPCRNPEPYLGTDGAPWSTLFARAVRVRG
jgi:hypothetical protein